MNTVYSQAQEGVAGLSVFTSLCQEYSRIWEKVSPHAICSNSYWSKQSNHFTVSNMIHLIWRNSLMDLLIIPPMFAWDCTTYISLLASSKKGSAIELPTMFSNVLRWQLLRHRHTSTSKEVQGRLRRQQHVARLQGRHWHSCATHSLHIYIVMTLQ